MCSCSGGSAGVWLILRKPVHTSPSAPATVNGEQSRGRDILLALIRMHQITLLYFAFFYTAVSPLVFPLFFSSSSSSALIVIPPCCSSVLGFLFFLPSRHAEASKLIADWRTPLLLARSYSRTRNVTKIKHKSWKEKGKTSMNRKTEHGLDTLLELCRTEWE